MSDVTGSGRRRERRAPANGSGAAREEQLSAAEMKRRLEATRARLKRQRPPTAE